MKAVKHHTACRSLPRVARIPQGSLLYMARLGVGDRFSNYRVRANITDTAKYSKSQLLETTKLCKLPFKVRVLLY